MATDSYGSSPLSPNKRRKTLSATSKSKIKDDANHNQQESQEQQQWTANSPCMICLSDCGKSVRGEIDCCDHFFCFICIMEWAKIESRCPACKRRFITIRRPFKDGVFAPERVVRVPLRDQIDTCYANTTAPFEPFSQVQCSVCHQMTDESLLLLCDLCDSASHTYCIGLGFTVPEGDWFCHDCTVCRTEHMNREMHIDCDIENVTTTAEEHVTILDIVRESSSPVADRKARAISSNPNQLSPAVAPDVENSVAEEVNVPGARMLRNVAERETQSGARTLQRCRDVHSHIQVLRKNWNAFRNGSLSFSSGSFKSGSQKYQRNVSAVLHARSGQQHSLSSTSCQHSTAEDAFAGSSVQNRGPHDIEKAWKMMIKAKSIESAHESTSCRNQVSKLPLKTGRASKDATGTVKNQQFGAKGLEKHNEFYSCNSEIGKYRSPKLEKQKKSSVSTKGSVESGEGLTTNSSGSFFKSSFSSNGWPSIQSDVYYQNSSRLLQKHVKGASSYGSTCLINLVGSIPGASDSLYAKAELRTSPPRKVDFSKETVRMGKGCTKSNARKDDDAKSEIQSLVKLNLKLLSRDKKLGVSAFKEIARLATHTILAACDLEHRKLGVHSFPVSSVCSHTEHIQQLHKSTLMPNSCRECFCIFVMDVVNSVMLEKVACVNTS
ncbi:uncharacterized protein LOC132185723 [Corylus avellana]|uniref:uncharacterized protein LOC132185723 n=1 Tax=Corylus avellana TaxID=13451 RepID=UPI00286BDE82|nr:uncharacterized protein LOC132185723 [Corylus avellana]